MEKLNQQNGLQTEIHYQQDLSQGDKSVVGSVVLSKFSHLSPCELGVYNTGQLSSLLSVLGDDIELNLSQSGDKFISMEFEDTKRKTKSKYMLSDLSVIPPPELKNLQILLS